MTSANPSVEPRALTAASRRLRRPTVAQLTLGLVLVGVLWRTVRYALGFPIWGDEAFVAVDLVVRDFREMIQPSVYGQIVPLAFYWGELAVSRVLGYSEWALHLLPYLAGSVALLLFWRFNHSVLPRRAALLSTGIFAAGFYLVRHGAEVKPYATDLLVSLGFTMLAWSVFRRPAAWVRWVILVAYAGLSIWCSYPAAFIGGGVGILLTWLLVQQRGRRGVVVGWLAFGVVLCASFAAMYYTFGKPHAEFAARLTHFWAETFPPVTRPVELLSWFLATHAGLMFAYPHGGSTYGSAATLLLFVVGCVRLARTQPALLLLLVAPLPFMLVAAAMHAYPYGGSARVTLHMAPAICLLAGLGLYTVLRRFLAGQRLRYALLSVSGALAVFMVAAMVSDILRPYQSLASLNSYRAVRAVARQSAAGDRWVIFNADREVPYAPNLRTWRGVGGQFVFDVLRFAPTRPDFAPQPDTLQPTPGQRVWLLAYRAIHRKAEFSDEQLADYVAQASVHLGRPKHESFQVKREIDRQGALKDESVEVYQFGR